MHGYSFIGIGKSIVDHHLNVNPEFKPVGQKLRQQRSKRREAAKTKIEKLLRVGVIESG